MKLKNKLPIITTSLVTILTTVAASPGHDEGTTTGMMMSDGSLMHTGANMMGYNMMGMGWFGLIPGLLIWILLILGIIYLYQQITENGGEEQ